MAEQQARWDERLDDLKVSITGIQKVLVWAACLCGSSFLGLIVTLLMKNVG